MRKLKNTELNRKSIDDFKKSKKTSAIVVLDNIRSIHNVGSIFRTSDSFLIEKIIISGYTATPENERMKKTALGSSDSVDWEYSDDIIETIKKLKKKDVKIISIEQADESLKIEKFNPVRGTKYAFIFGNEVDGVSDDIINVSDEVVEIESTGSATFEDVKDLVAGQRGRVVFEEGDLEHGIWSAGISVARVKDVPTCKEMVSRLVSDAEDIIDGRLQSIKA